MQPARKLLHPRRLHREPLWPALEPSPQAPISGIWYQVAPRLLAVLTLAQLWDLMRTLRLGFSLASFFGFEHVHGKVDKDDAAFDVMKGSGKTHTFTKLAERAAEVLERQPNGRTAHGQRL